MTENLDPSSSTGTPQELSISLEYEFMRAQRYRRAVSCVVVRVDNLPDVVDRTRDGDPRAVLRNIDLGIRTCIRLLDHLYRSAAAEFTIILPETDAAGASIVVDRLVSGAKDASLWPSLLVAPQLRVASASYPEEEVETGAALHTLAKSKF